MSWSVLQRIVDSLVVADYRGWFAFHNYNEPLANPRLLEEMRLVRDRLPHSKLAIYTNGDRLSDTLFQKLVTAGLSQMRITLYPKRGRSSPSSFAVLRTWLERHPFLEALEWEQVDLRQGPSFLHLGLPEIMIISPDVGKYYDRGGTIPKLSRPNRTSPCLLTSNSLSVDYLGNVKMCCNVVTGYAPHQDYFLGDAAQVDILEVWNSTKFERLRKKHVSADWSSSSLCSTCSQVLGK